MSETFDVLIAGGGLVGQSLALALSDSDLNIGLIEAQSRDEQADSAISNRALALAHGSCLMLSALSAWDAVADQASPIEHIHISDQGHFGHTRLNAADAGVPSLGQVIIARPLEQHLNDRVGQTAVKQFRPARLTGLNVGEHEVIVSLHQGNDVVTLRTRLLVAADGGQSPVRQYLNIQQQITDYRQSAIVTTVGGQQPHRQTAFERFTAHGPLALLPQPEQSLAVVWSQHNERAQMLSQLSDAAFLAELQQVFGYRLGALQLTAPRHQFPLALIKAEVMVKPRVVLIGNAMHQLHPVAGQGFNLGLRDAARLAECLLDDPELDPGDSGRLNAYAAGRQQDLQRVIQFTDRLVKLFSNNWSPLAHARSAGLALLDNLPPAKTWLSRQAMGLGDGLPRIGQWR